MEDEELLLNDLRKELLAAKRPRREKKEKSAVGSDGGNHGRSAEGEEPQTLSKKDLDCLRKLSKDFERSEIEQQQMIALRLHREEEVIKRSRKEACGCEDLKNLQASMSSDGDGHTPTEGTAKTFDLEARLDALVDLPNGGFDIKVGNRSQRHEIPTTPQLELEAVRTSLRSGSKTFSDPGKVLENRTSPLPF
jgi:hypothetical protein